MQNVTFRKTRDGEWVVQGPRDLLVSLTNTVSYIMDVETSGDDDAALKYTTVTLKSGKRKNVIVRSVGRGFDRDGVETAYGYLWDPSELRTVQTAAVIR